MKRMFKKTYLEVDFAENKLENDKVLREKKFGLREVGERQCEGNRECLKNCHISLIKLKKCIFRGLDSREISCEKHH